MSSQTPLTQITLRFEASNIPKLDVMSESDPFLVVKMAGANNAPGARVGTTEIVQNDPNPQWVTSITVPYMFNTLQRLDFEVYDADNSNTDVISGHDFVGRASIYLGELVCAPMMTVSLALTGSKHPKAMHASAELTVRAEDANSGGLQLRMKPRPRGTGLGPRRVTLKKTAEGASRSVPVASARAGKTLEVSVGALCGGDLDRNVEFEVLKTNIFGTQKVVANATMSARALLESADQAGAGLVPLLKPAPPGARPKTAGSLRLTGLTRFERPTFIDFLRGGLNLELSVAIDFTASNGAANDPRSLHHYTPKQPTAYAQALEAVGNVLLQYDSDRSVPVFGFGGYVPSGGVSHCFPLSPSGDFSNTPCHSVADMLAAYYRGVSSVQLAGPTNFAPFLRQLRAQAQEAAAAARAGGPLSFQVALILTDGAITDMRDTIDEVVALASLPAALIIVGVGGANFDSMEELDADSRPLYARSGAKAEADIVQFVPFRQFARAGPAALTAAVLEELPDCVVHYFERRGIPVPKPVQASAQQGVKRASPAAPPSAVPSAPSFVVN